MNQGPRQAGLFERIGRFSYRHRRFVVVAWLALVLLSLPAVLNLSGSLRVGGFSSGDTEGA